MSGRDALPADMLRAQFPCFATPAWEGVHYLDNAATTQKPRCVIDAVGHALGCGTSPVNRGLYPLAEAATLQYEAARKSVARFIGARSARQIVFTPSATAGINQVAVGWAAPRLMPGDEVCVTAMEHHANLLPWQRVCRHRGARLRVVEFGADGRLDPAAVQAALTPRTRLLALTHVSNVFGTINPVAELAAMARAVGARTLVDASQSVAHLPLDVGGLGCDFLVFSGHKLYGPPGIGVLWGDAARLGEMEPAVLGGGMVSRVDDTDASWSDVPERFEAGSPNLAGAIGLARAVRFLTAARNDGLRVRQERLEQAVLAALLKVPGLHLVGPAEPEDRTGIYAFTLDGIHPHDAAAACGETGVCVRGGNHCCQPLHARLGIPGTVRASLALYNGEDDALALADALGFARRYLQ